MYNRNFNFRVINSVGGGGIKRKIVHNIFDELITLENLFLSWNEFKKGKTKRKDVQEFKFNLEDNIFQLYQELKDKTYQHSFYSSFYVQDPKLRHIHKAMVRDRIVHHLISKTLEEIYDGTYIFDSYSCRKDKGTHKAVNRLGRFCGKLSQNNTENIYYLKCDIKKFFDSINHEILIEILKKKIKDDNLLFLLKEIIKSFNRIENQGIPLGNLTSQYFANIYLNELDQFIKHSLKIKYYVRYSDDFIILNKDKAYLENLILIISSFLKENLNLSLHPDKIIIKKYHQGIDFLGYVLLPYHRVLRTKTKKRIFRKISQKMDGLKNNLITKKSFNQTLQSYFGVLKHCNGHKIKEKIDCLIRDNDNK
jgi:retron-type reverse transcriptase